MLILYDTLIPLCFKIKSMQPKIQEDSKNILKARNPGSYKVLNNFIETDRSIGVDPRILNRGDHSFNKHLLSKPDSR